MPISPEIGKIPAMAIRFTKAGLTRGIITDMLSRGKIRNLSEDANLLVQEYERDTSINILGLENIVGGGLLMFNHPNNDVLLPAILKLITLVRKEKNIDVSLVVASEITLSAKYNDKTALPGSRRFIGKLHSLYPDNIISAPTVRSGDGFELGRAVAARKVIKRISQGQIVAISPEGHIEINNQVSPTESFHRGSGTLARLTRKMGKDVIPVGIWKSGKSEITLVVGKPLSKIADIDDEVVKDVMSNIAGLLPQELRGPFKNVPAYP